ncbi:MAG: hypothetical protein L6262_00975 [Weeksellaceae bacterium]|nr:hypothetical protein [Weeksellaceae bacterium]
MKIIVWIFLLLISCHQNTENISIGDDRKVNRSFENKNFITDSEGNKYVIEDLFKTLVKYKKNSMESKHSK